MHPTTYNRFGINGFVMLDCSQPLNVKEHEKEQAKLALVRCMGGDGVEQSKQAKIFFFYPPPPCQTFYFVLASSSLVILFLHSMIKKNIQEN